MAKTIPEENTFEEPTWKKTLKSIGSAIWTGLKWTFKAFVWAGKKWWEYLDKIASQDPNDFKKTDTTTQEGKVQTIMVNGKLHYKDKKGNYRPMDV